MAVTREEASTAREVRGFQRGGINPTAANILCVDDDGDWREAMREVLEDRGYLVFTAATGSEAIDLARTVAFDLALLDMQLPDVTGTELHAELVKLQPGLDIFVVTGHASLETAIKSVHNRATGYMQKPVRVEELLQRIQRQLELRRADREIGRLARLLEATFDSIPDQLILLDDFLRVMDVNRAAEKEMGKEKAELIGLSYESVCMLREKERPAFIRALENAFKSKRSHAFEGYFKVGEKDAGERLFKAMLYPVSTDKLMESGDRYAILLFEDVTARIVSERELRSANDRLRKANDKLNETMKALKRTQAGLVQTERMAAVGQLAAGVAHEINNPSSYVLSNLQILERYLDALEGYCDKAKEIMADPEIKDPGAAIEKIELDSSVPDVWLDSRDIINECLEGMERVKNIVHDLSIFAGSSSDEMGDADLNQLVRSNASMLMNQIRYRARLKMDLGELPRVVANSGRMSQVLVNLIQNAIKAIPEGETDANLIEIRTWAEDDAVKMSVKDTGVGISRENLPRIFDPFFTTRQVGEGTGLGLAISYDIIKKHGGSIEVESRPGAGTEVTVSLPTSSMEFSPGQAWVESEEIIERDADDLKGVVLLVDDEEAIIKSYQRLLPSSLHILTASTGLEAMRVLEERDDIDVIVCDMMMPDLAGDEVYRRISSLKPEYAERFVFITGGAFTDKTRDFTLSVESRLMEKPFGMDDFLEAIREVLEHGK